MINTGEWKDVKTVEFTQTQFLTCLTIHPLQGSVQGLQRTDVLVGACWPHEVELLSFLILLWALGGIALAKATLHRNTFSLCFCIYPPHGHSANVAALL